MIERHEGRQQIVCDTCPAAYQNTYADEDFAVMVSDAKTAGWSICKALPAANPRDTADLFGRAPRVAGKAAPQPYTHTCPTCRTRPESQRSLI